MDGNGDGSIKRRIKKGDVDIFCTQCNRQVPDELLETLIDGGKVFCEYCGSEISLSAAGTYYDDKKPIPPQSVHSAPKQRDDWGNIWDRLLEGLRKMFDRLGEAIKRIWSNWEEEWNKNQERAQERRSRRAQRVRGPRHRGTRMNKMTHHRTSSGFGYVPPQKEQKTDVKEGIVNIEWNGQSQSEKSEKDKEPEQPERKQEKLPEKPLEKFDAREIPGAKFDPQTGKPLFPQKTKTESQTLRSIPTIYSETNPSENGFSELREKIFNILSPEVKQKLDSLTLPDVELNPILESFVLLNKEIQLKYLDEIEKLNDSDKIINPKLVERIKKLQIPKKDQDNLISELYYLADEKQNEFVEFMEEGEEEEPEKAQTQPRKQEAEKKKKSKRKDRRPLPI